MLQESLKNYIFMNTYFGNKEFYVRMYETNLTLPLRNIWNEFNEIVFPFLEKKN